MSGSNSINPALELAQLEMEAQATAAKHVANLLQRPDQLDKVDHIRKRVNRKKGSVEAMLKTAVQSQLDGVKTGLNQLHNALKDIKDIKENIRGIEDTYQSVKGLGDHLKAVRVENSRHCQLAAAVENLKHIFTVPETVKKCEDLISEGKLLHAHKCLTDLEGSRDDLLFELHKQAVPSPTDRHTVMNYFGDVNRLSDMLAKQLWLILQRTLITVRREPTIIVTVMRIVEREERTDILMMKRYDQTEFLPPGRPKRWRQKVFSVLEEAVHGRIEGSQMEDREMNKMWLVRHLEVIRQLTIEDLRVVKTLCGSCFPPHYEIVTKYVEMYHKCIAEHIDDLINQGLEGNEIVSLLGWVSKDYTSSEFMGHPDLKIDLSELSPLLEPNVMSQQQNTYLQIMGSNFQEWMANSLTSDQKDWMRDVPPDANEKGYFLTSIPVILFQMIEQNLQVAATIGPALTVAGVNLCINELSSFVRMYRTELFAFKEKHFMDRSVPKFFLQYMIANVNNCLTFTELLEQIAQKYELDPTDIKRVAAVADSFHNLAAELNDILLDEVFMDLDTHVQSILTKQWMYTSNPIDTICITIEDYCQDFIHVQEKYFAKLLIGACNKVGREYLRAIFSRKMTFKNYEERLPAAEKMCREADQFNQLFTRLIPATQTDSPFDVIPTLAEILKLKDSSMLSLEVSGFVNNYPDVRTEQLINVLLMRGDISRNEARTLIVDCLGEDHDTKPKAQKTILTTIGGL